MRNADKLTSHPTVCSSFSFKLWSLSYQESAIPSLLHSLFLQSLSPFPFIFLYIDQWCSFCTSSIHQRTHASLILALLVPLSILSIPASIHLSSCPLVHSLRFPFFLSYSLYELSLFWLWPTYSFLHSFSFFQPHIFGCSVNSCPPISANPSIKLLTKLFFFLASNRLFIFDPIFFSIHPLLSFHSIIPLSFFFLSYLLLPSSVYPHVAVPASVHPSISSDSIL